MKNIETRVRPTVSKQLLLQDQDLPNLDVPKKTIEEWRSIKSKFMQIILEPTEDGMEARKASFLEALSNLIY